MNSLNNKIIPENHSSGKTILELVNQENAAIFVKREIFKANMEAIRNGEPIIEICQDNYKYFDENNKFIPQRLGNEILSILTIKKGPNEALFYLENNKFELAEQVIKHLISQLLGNRYTQFFERDTIAYLKSYLPEEKMDFNSNTMTFPKLTCLSNVRSEDITWLWEPYLPLGKLSILEGDPGQGKTFLALALAAVVSNGWSLLNKDGTMTQPVKKGRVLYLTCEDGLADTLRPRLEKMGANLENIIALEGQYITGSEEIKAVSIQDVNVLRSALEQVEPSLVVIDPIQGFLGPGINMNRAEEVRPLMSILGKLATEFKCAILIIRHLTKSGKDRVGYRGMGSIDFTGAARSVLLVGKNPDNEADRVIVHTKSNLSEYGKSIGFTINDGKFEWLGHVEVTAAEVLAPERVDFEDEEEKTPYKEARKYLIDNLKDGAKPAKEILDGVQYSGFSIRTLKSAKAALKIQSFKQGDIWYWSFPPDAIIEDD